MSPRVDLIVFCSADKSVLVVVVPTRVTVCSHCGGSCESVHAVYVNELRVAHQGKCLQMFSCTANYQTWRRIDMTVHTHPGVMYAVAPMKDAACSGCGAPAEKIVLTQSHCPYARATSGQLREYCGRCHFGYVEKEE